ncbi:alpha/beta-Hydrolases superfamily protein [Abeliophyllum distichum]|uniref:Alpha/beta-Hydrolases superfamily protein n=1 Tax=Abeliophyllum distichum TaxID=126358 RepID=A0ABD1V7V0_9LAMI
MSTAMNAKIIGSGEETLVLAHGFGTDQSIWDKVVPYLADHCQVVVFDWCFSGAVKDPDLYDAAKYSTYDAFADDIICLLDEMKLKSSVFVGHSMSGMIGCIASIKRPDLFHKLILVTTSPRFLNSEDYEGGFELSDVEQIFSSIESNYEQWTSSFSVLVVDSSDPESVEKLEKSLKRMRPEVALTLAKTVFLIDHRDMLEKVTTPCYIIHTRNDIVVPNSVPEYMQNKIKGECKVEIINTNGHFPQLTAHHDFVEVIDAILADK